MNILISDIDGTLIKNHHVNELDIRRLHDFVEEGNMFALATGRPYCATKHLQQMFRTKYMICCNGAIIFDDNQQTIYQQIMDHDSVSAVVSYYEPNMYMFISDGKTLTPITDNHQEFNDEIVFISITLKEDNFAFLEQLANQLSSENPNITCVLNGNHLDIGAQNVSKANGIKWLVENKNINSEDILVVGDNFNDISMFEAFYDHSYAIASGQPLAVSKAKYQVNYIGEIISDDDYNVYK